MTKEERQRLVTEGFNVDQEIKGLSKRLDEIKEVLAGAANGKDAEFAGDGCLVTVGFYPSLARVLPAEKEEQAKELAGRFFNKLFCRAPIAKFKDIASALLGDKATGLVELLSGPESARVSFKKA